MNSFKTILLIISVYTYNRCKRTLGRNVEVRIQLSGVCSFLSLLYAPWGLNSGHLGGMASTLPLNNLVDLEINRYLIYVMGLTMPFIMLGV